MKVYVIDASVAARFLLVEDLSEEAQLLLQGFLNQSVELTAPGLIRVEVGNALWNAVERKSIGVREAVKQLNYFHELRIDSFELSDGDCAEAFAWAARKHATYYDSLYVRTAELLGSTLLSADEELCEKASGAVSTLHLRDLASSGVNMIPP